MTSQAATRFVLRAGCMDAIGIVADIAGFLVSRRLFIIETSNFGGPLTGRFFLRVVFATARVDLVDGNFRKEFPSIVQKWKMEWDRRDTREQPNVTILVARQGHCLNDLLYRQRIGALAMDAPAIVSNRDSCAWLAEGHSIPFHFTPVEAGSKRTFEAHVLELVEEMNIDLVVLARFIQIQSNDTCEAQTGRRINIHDSFLSAFKGTAPYSQAFSRDVNLIGATAHYVTDDLEEGPIIAPVVEPAVHSDTSEMLAAIGRDIKTRVLAQAIKLHLESRTSVNDTKMVVLR